MRRHLTVWLAGAAISLASAGAGGAPTGGPSYAVGPQYGSTHVYMSAEALPRFAKSFVATFGGRFSPPSLGDVTPRPSKTLLTAVQTPVGLLSVFGFTTGVPWPFGDERTGYLVTDMDAAVAAARAAGADVLVTPFPDPIGRDAILEWPGGVRMQFYVHNTPPSLPALVANPENRIYVSPEGADAFMKSFLAFSHGVASSDEAAAPGAEIGLPGKTYRRVRISSGFGEMVLIVTDGHLPWPYGRELAGYEVADLDATLHKARTAGAIVVVAPRRSEGRMSAMVQFPGGYVAEIHSPCTTC